MGGKKFGEGRSGAQAPAVRETSSTLAFDAQRLGVEGPTGAFPPTPARLLDIVREKISRCRVMRNESGIATTMNGDKTMMVYSTLPSNLRGSCMLNIGEKKFIVGRTRSTWFLLYEMPPEEIYEDTRFMDVDLKRRDVLVLETGKTMYLSRISRNEIDMLNGIAAVANGRKAQQKDTIAPSLDSAVSYAGLAAKLSKATEVSSDDPFFDMAEFVRDIKFMTMLQDQNGNPHYYIVSGDSEHAFYLYVNSGSKPATKCLFETTFKYKDDACVLYRED